IGSLQREKAFLRIEELNCELIEIENAPSNNRAILQNRAKCPISRGNVRIRIEQITFDLGSDCCGCGRRRRRSAKADESGAGKPRQPDGTKIGPNTGSVLANTVAAEAIALAVENFFASRRIPEDGRICGCIRGGLRCEGFQICNDHPGLLVGEIERLHCCAGHAFADDRSDFFVCRRAAKLSGHQSDPLHLIAGRPVAAGAVRLKQPSALCHFFGGEGVLRKQRAREKKNNDQSFHTDSNSRMAAREFSHKKAQKAQEVFCEFYAFFVAAFNCCSLCQSTASTPLA